MKMHTIALRRAKFRPLLNLLELLICVVIAALGVAGAHAQIPVFSDTFENGSITDSQALVGYWVPSTGTNCITSETGGKLIMTAGNATSPNGVLGVRISSGAPKDDFNFFKRKLRFSADMTVSGSYGVLRFALTGTQASNYIAEDALIVMISSYNSVTLATKQNRPNINVESVTVPVNYVTVSGTITGFDLTLDAVNYTLVITYQGGTKTFTGTHGLVASQWGTDGKTSLQFETMRGSGGATGAGITVTGTVDNFLVTRYDTPVVFEDSFANGITSDSDLETNIWTSILPGTSTISETMNGLVQAVSTDTTMSYKIASHYTPVQSRFNFFDRQLKVSAAATVTGSLLTSTTSPDIWLMRSRLALTSEAKSVNGASDAIVFGFCADYIVSLTTKTDGPGVNPEYTAAASNKYLLEGNSSLLYSARTYFNYVDLTLNSKRYCLAGRPADKSFGLYRFTGSHKIDRSKWGANGDSAIVLETLRDATSSSLIATTTWDNLRVDTDSAKMLDEPFWTFTATYSTPSSTQESGSFRLWLPSSEPVIRGIIFIGPGDGGDCRLTVHDPMVQEACRAMGFGVIGYTWSARMNLMTDNASQIKLAVQAVLDRAAVVSGRPEISNAPLCITGNSRGAFDSGYLVHHWPERVVAFVPHCGGEWSNPSLSAAAKKVPGLFVTGSDDGNNLTYAVTMQTMFGWWRSQGAQVAYAVDWNVGHTWYGNVGWEATFVWMAEVAKLRYPRPMVPSQTPGVLPTLINLDETSGWLGDHATFTTSNVPNVTYPFTKVTPYASYSGTVSAASWLPNETCARVYRALTSTDRVKRSVTPTQSPLRIVTPGQFDDPIVSGATVTIAVDPRDFGVTNPIVSMEFYDGDAWLGTVSSGPAWQWAFTPAAGAHVLSVVAADSLGNKRDAFRSLYVWPADFTPTAYRQSNVAQVTVPYTGTVSGLDPEGNAVTYAVAQQPGKGTLTLNASTGAYTYTANVDNVATDSFSFTVTDGTLTSDPAVVQFKLSAGPVGGIATMTASPGVTSGDIILSWSASSNADTYLIERSTLSNSGFVQIATLSAPLLTYTDSNLTLYLNPTSNTPAYQTYYYRVRGSNALGQSTYTSVVSTQPKNLYAIVGNIDTVTATPGDGVNEIAVSWGEAANASAYQIEISSDGGLTYERVATVSAPSRTYTFNWPWNWQDYRFRVYGLNPGHTGAYSAEVSSKPNAPTMADWRYLNFDSADVEPGYSGDLDAPLGDGVTNLMRYALGCGIRDSFSQAIRLSPTSLPYVKEQMIHGEPYLTCTFTHNKVAQDLTIKVEVADDPNGPWTQIDPFAAANQVSVADNTPDSGVETIVVKDSQPIGTGNKRFMRLRVLHP